MMRVNMYKRVIPDGWAYVRTLPLTDDLVRVISTESGMTETRIRERLEGGANKGIVAGQFRYIPVGGLR